MGVQDGALSYILTTTIPKVDLKIPKFFLYIKYPKMHEAGTCSKHMIADCRQCGR